VNLIIDVEEKIKLKVEYISIFIWISDRYPTLDEEISDYFKRKLVTVVVVMAAEVELVLVLVELLQYKPTRCTHLCIITIMF
jgi:hypothetical protein